MYLGHHGDLLCVCNPVQVFFDSLSPAWEVACDES